MRLHRTITTAAGALLLLAVGLAEPAAAAPSIRPYRTIDLGTLGGTLSFGLAVNKDGDVTGQSETASGTLEAFLWHDGKMTNLGVLDPSVRYSVGSDLNNIGWVVGTSDVLNGTAMHGFVWRNGVMTDVGTLGGRFSVADAVNDRGQVVGRSETASGQWHAFLWQDGTMTDLGLDNATDINNRGQLVGGTPIGSGFHGYRWRNGVVTDLGAIAGDVSQAAAINEHGHVVGGSATDSFVNHAFFYRDTMIDLGTLGGPFSDAVAINDSDQVLGVSSTADGQLHGFVWRDGRMVDLTGLGIPTNADVRDVNNSGQISGAYYPTSGQPHAALFV
jgi:probable HAF family extracellular repeat protein